MIVDTSNVFKVQGWRLHLAPPGVQIFIDDGCNNQTVTLQLSPAEAQQLGAALTDAAAVASARAKADPGSQ